MRRWLGALALLGTFAGFTIASYVGAQMEHDEPAISALLTSTRGSLSLCAANLGGQAVSDAEFSGISTALEAALTEAPRVPVEYADPSLVRGCPPAELRPEDGVSMWERLTRLGSRVASPSEHRAFVYVVPDDEYAAGFGTAPYIRATAESVCELDVCRGVTSSLYVPSSTSDDALTAGLMDALGILPAMPEPTIDWAPCESGLSEPRCARYEELNPEQSGTD